MTLLLGLWLRFPIYAVAAASYLCRNEPVMNGAPSLCGNAVEEQPQILRLPLVAQDDSASMFEAANVRTTGNWMVAL